MERFARGEDTGEQSNIAGHIQHKLGDVEKGFQEAAVIVEREFHTQTVHQGYIIPCLHGVLVGQWPGDDLDQHAGHLAVRAATAAILGIAESQVKVIPMEIGGGFGGKGMTYLRPGGDRPRQEKRPSGEDCDESSGGVRGHRPRLRDLHAGQDRRHQRWHHHRGPALPGV